MSGAPSEPAAHDPEEEFDDLPATHLDDEAYDEFVRREFDRSGRLRGGPPVTAVIVVLIVLVLAVAFVVLR